MWGNSAYCWKTVFTSRRYGGVPTASTPPIRISPSSGCSKPAIIRSEVVLPQPLGPSSDRNSPLWTRRLTAFTATREPNRFVTARNSTSLSPAPAAAAPGCDVVVAELMAEGPSRDGNQRISFAAGMSTSDIAPEGHRNEGIRVSPPPLDEANRRIIEILQRDGRAGFSAIG